MLGALFLSTMLFPLAALAEGKLTLWVYPSPVGIDWSSPSSLGWSAVKNELAPSRYSFKHSIGHVNVQLDCGARSVVTGMTSSGSSVEAKALLSEKIGLGVLFRDFAGELESREKVEAQIPERLKGGAFSHLTFAISDATCERLLEFHDGFEARGYSGHYGLPLRPRWGEGAGCSAYATAYLDLAGLLTPEMKERWSKNILVPIDMIGGGEAGSPMRKVSLMRLLFSFWRKWATPEQEHRAVQFWDPDAIHAWIREVFDSSRDDFGRISIERTKGLTLDATQVPTPADPIWR